MANWQTDAGSAVDSSITKEMKGAVGDGTVLKVIDVEDYIETGGSISASKDTTTTGKSQIPDTYNIFFLGEGGLPDSKRQKAIEAAKKLNFHLGYQLNFHLDYAKNFGSYLDTLVTNMGDAFQEGNYLTVNSKCMETAVLDYYAQLWHAKWPHDEKDLESYWGFCTGSADEGNLYGMWNGRDYLSGKKILVDNSVLRSVYQKCVVPTESPNAYTPIAFYTEDTHYSSPKAMAMLEIQSFYAEGQAKYPGQCPITDDGSWPAEVPSDDSGTINIDVLATFVEFFASRGYPILVCLNYGTTFKGAYDDVADACNKLYPILAKYNLLEREVKYDVKGETHVETRTGFWLHVDGALGAAYMPFMEFAHDAGRVANKGPDFDFRLPMVHSISMSGHEWIGAAVPCGVYMTKTKFQMLPTDVPEHIGTLDTTLAGSRNGLAPMLLWDNIARHSYADQTEKALQHEELAAYMESKLRHLQDEVLKTDLYVERTPLSLTVHFKRANDELCNKYSLSNKDMNGKKYSNVVMMEHVNKELVDALIADLSKEGAFATTEAAVACS